MQFVSRQQWGAQPPKSEPDKLVVEDILGQALHYTASNADEKTHHTNCPGRVRATQMFHMEERQWNDIAYTHLVCKHGYVFEGRGWGVVPAAVENHNQHYHSICFLGDDTSNFDDVTIAGRRALRQILDRGMELYPKALLLHPHSFFNDTSCPGNQLRAWLVKFKAAV